MTKLENMAPRNLQDWKFTFLKYESHSSVSLNDEPLSEVDDTHEDVILHASNLQFSNREFERFVFTKFTLSKAA